MVTLRCKCKRVGVAHHKGKGKAKKKACAHGRYKKGKKKGRCKK